VVALKETQGTWHILLIQRSHAGISAVRTEPMGCKALSTFTNMLFQIFLLHWKHMCGQHTAVSIIHTTSILPAEHQGPNLQIQLCSSITARPGMKSSSGMNGGYKLSLFCPHCLQLSRPCGRSCTS